MPLYSEVYREAPRLTLSEWADEYGYLSDGQRWDTSVVPYLREIMDATTDRDVRVVVVMKASRLGYTEGVMGQRVAYNIHQDPAPTLVILPTEDGHARPWSQKFLSKMIAASPALREVIPEARGRDSGNTILDKEFPGGSVTIRGAHSPAKLRLLSARDVIFDEVDGMKVVSGEEGDPIMLGARAVRVPPDSTEILGSTPGHKHNSRIWKALKESDWREYHVPCPHCKELQVLKWGGPDKPYGVKWAKEIACKGCGVEVAEGAEECPDCGGRELASTHLPETAHYVCEHCGEAIDASHKPWMLKEQGRGGLARWVPRHPGRAGREDDPRATRGYHISGLLSPFDGSSWARMAAEFLKAKDDPAMLQVWVNQWLGEPYEDRGQTADVRALEARAVQFVGADGEVAEVPDGVGVLTAGVDVQHDRLEVLVRGYGVRWESWDILHERIYGAPQLVETWARLDHFLTRGYHHELGGVLRIVACMVDSGDGQTNEHVYRFVRTRQQRNIWASKGDRGDPTAAPEPKAPRKATDGIRLWTVPTFPAKSSLLYRLRVGRPGPNYVHLRGHTPALCNGFDAEYFAQFQAEEKKRVRVPGSSRYAERFVQVRQRNEAIDLHVLADSAFRALGAAVLEGMPKLVEQARARPEEKPQGPAGKNRLKGPKRRSGWVNKWKQ